MGKKNDDFILMQLRTAFEPKEREWIAADLGLPKEDETALDKSFIMTITKVGLIVKPELKEKFSLKLFPGGL